MRNIAKGKKLLVLTFTFALLFHSVFGNRYITEAAKTDSVKKITVKAGNKRVDKKTYSIKKGMSKVLEVSVSPKSTRKAVVFSSNRKSVVSVSRKGKITAKKKGTAKITITVTGADNKKRTTWVKVKVTAKSSAANKSQTAKKGNTPITLTIGNTVLDGYLNDSKAAKSLLAKLPLSVTLDDSDNDFCGGNLNLKYDKKDVQYGYKNGDLAFWTPANNFVIFVNGEENSADTGDLVILGRITSPQKMLDSLKGTIKVTIRKK